MKRPFYEGAFAGAPIAVSVIPFGIIAGVMASDVGMSMASAGAFSVIVFAGASQLAALELAQRDAPALFIIAAAAVINLRFAMYSAALSSHVKGLGRFTRIAMAYLLTDQAFALSVTRLDTEPRRGVGYFFGAALSLWLAWQVGTWIGIGVGSRVPPELSLDFCVALAFIALFVPHVTTRPTVAVAATSISVFALTSDLPYGLALLPAAVAGMSAGLLVERLSR